MIILLITPFMAISIWHLKRRKFNYYTWGTVIVVGYIAAGLLYIYAIPLVAIIISVIIEAINSSLIDNERKRVEESFSKYENAIKDKIIAARKEIEKYRIVKSYTIDNYAEFRRDLKSLEKSELWHSTRSGILTSIITTEENYLKCCEILEVEPMDKPEFEIDNFDMEKSDDRQKYSDEKISDIIGADN